jgi:hypothetical protein
MQRAFRIQAYPNRLALPLGRPKWDVDSNCRIKMTQNFYFHAYQSLCTFPQANLTIALSAPGQSVYAEAVLDGECAPRSPPPPPIANP